MRHFDPDRAPFTDDQVRYLEEGRRESVRRAVHHYRNQALVGFLLLLTGFGVNTYIDRQDTQSQQDALVSSAKAVAVDGCNRDFVDRARFRNLLERLKDSARLSYRAGRTTQEQYETAVLFYDSQLREFSLLDCRDAEALLTTDKTNQSEPPKPYYPGGPNNPPNLEG